MDKRVKWLKKFIDWFYWLILGFVTAKYLIPLGNWGKILVAILIVAPLSYVRWRSRPRDLEKQECQEERDWLSKNSGAIFLYLVLVALITLWFFQRSDNILIAISEATAIAIYGSFVGYLTVMSYKDKRV